MKTSIWLIAACLATSLHAQAASFKPVELKDTEMAELRGRYVMPGRIISFGIVMNSTWTSSNGGVVGASTSMYVQNTIEPKFYVSTYSSAGNGAPGSNGTGSVTGGAGLTTAQGVTQSVRAAGDNNSAYNNVDINVSEADQAPVVNQQGVLLTTNTSITQAAGAGNVTVSATAGAFSWPSRPTTIKATHCSKSPRVAYCKALLCWAAVIGSITWHNLTWYWVTTCPAPARSIATSIN